MVGAGVDRADGGGRAGGRWLRSLAVWGMSREGLALLALLAVAVVVRLVALPFRGFFDDLQAFVTWGRFLDRHFWDFYSAGVGLNPVPDYPPLAMYLFGFLMWLYEAGCALFHQPFNDMVELSPGLAAILKLPALLADVALTALVYAIARRRFSSRGALLAAAGYALSPAIFFGGVLWGQLDMLFTLGVVAALALTIRGRAGWAGVALGLAVMIKLPPILLAPLPLVYLWRVYDWRRAARAALAMGATILAICAPYLLPPRFEMLAYYHDLHDWVVTLPYTSVSAFNLWWLLGLQRAPYDHPFLGPLTPNLVGAALGAAALALALAGLWHSPTPARLYFGAGLLTATIFTVGTLQHERYILPSVAFFLLAAIYDRRALAFYLAASVIAFLDLALVVVNPVFMDSRTPFAPGRSFLRANPWVYGWLSLANVALLAASLAAWAWDVAPPALATLRRIASARPIRGRAERTAAWLTRAPRIAWAALRRRTSTRPTSLPGKAATESERT